MNRAERLMAVSEAAYQWRKNLDDPKYDITEPQKPISDYNEHSATVSATPEQTEEFLEMVKQQITKTLGQ